MIKKVNETKVTTETQEKKKFVLFGNKEKLEQAKKDIQDKKTKKLLKNKLLYVIIVITILIISLITFALISYTKNLRYESYIKYEEKMKTYGFDIMYNNKSAKTSESVTEAEALKLVLSAVFNTNDISGFAEEHNEYENATWVEYAKYFKIAKNDININNFNHKAKYIDVISYLENCKLNFLKDISIKDTDIKVDDITQYTVEEQTAIKDMIANEIIALMSNKINGKEEIFKGQLNELIINFVEKYNTITMSGDKININPEKIPANADQYPYTLATVDKATYEIPFKMEYTPDSLTAKDLYSLKKELYPQVKSSTQDFLNIMLNVDYKTITEDSLRAKIQQYLIFAPNESAIKVYVKYVKDNEIVIEGKSELQVPIIYSDGFSFRARVKLTFEVKHSNTKLNLLYLDCFDNLNKTYEKSSYEILVDIPLTNAIGSNKMYMEERDLYDTILNKESCGITKEVDNEFHDIQEENNEGN
jgi:hypothetical protein